MAKTQAELDDDARFRNRFRDGGDDEPMKRHQKKVFNRATGTFEKPAQQMDTAGWWKEKLGFGKGKPPKKGTGALAKRRKKALDDQIKKGGG